MAWTREEGDERKSVTWRGSGSGRKGMVWLSDAMMRLGSSEKKREKKKKKKGLGRGRPKHCTSKDWGDSCGIPRGFCFRKNESGGRKTRPRPGKACISCASCWMICSRGQAAATCRRVWCVAACRTVGSTRWNRPRKKWWAVRDASPGFCGTSGSTLAPPLGAHRPREQPQRCAVLN